MARIVLDGYNAENSSTGVGAASSHQYATGTWAAACYEGKQQSVDSFGLLVIVLVLIAAGALVRVVSMFV